MKILVVGDLHGRRPTIGFKDFDCIVAVGDFSSDKELKPLKDKWVRELESGNFEGGLDDFLVKKVGRGKLNEMTNRSLKEGRKILKYLDSFGKPVFIVGGNWDESYGKTRVKDMEKSDYNYSKGFLDFWLGDKMNPILVKGLKNIKNCMFHLWKFGGVNFVGYGLSSAPENPVFRKKRKFSKAEKKKLKNAYEKIIKKLDSESQRQRQNSPVVFITHNIPYNTKLDIVKLKNSRIHKKHLGSTVARNFCLKKRPVLCVGGHIHEGCGKDKLGKTVVLNPGYGKDAQVLVDLDEVKGRIKKIKFFKSK